MNNANDLNQQKHISPKKGLIIVLCMPILGGLDYVFLEYITSNIDAISLACIRTAIGAVFFLIAHHFLVGRLHIDRKDLPRFLLAGGFGVGIYYVFEIIGISMTSAALSSLLISIVPIFTIIGDRIFFGHKITRLKAFGAIMSVIGVGVIIAGSADREMSGTLLGILILLFAAVFWTVYILASKPLNDKYSPLTITTVLFVIGAIVLLPVFFLHKPQSILALTPGNWLLILLFTIVCIAIADLLYMYGISSLPVVIPSIVVNLLPFVTIIVSWVVFHTMLGLLQLLGGLLIIASVIMTALDKADRTDEGE